MKSMDNVQGIHGFSGHFTDVMAKIPKNTK